MQEEKMIEVVYCRPGEKAGICRIGTRLEELQEAVGGLIETFYPFEEAVCIVCNDEGKIRGMPPNRAIREEGSGRILDIICGSFFICDAASENFRSLNGEQLIRYKEKFERPEFFMRIDGVIEAVPYEPV